MQKPGIGGDDPGHVLLTRYTIAKSLAADDMYKQ